MPAKFFIHCFNIAGYYPPPQGAPAADAGAGGEAAPADDGGAGEIHDQFCAQKYFNLPLYITWSMKTNK